VVLSARVLLSPRIRRALLVDQGRMRVLGSPIHVRLPLIDAMFLDRRGPAPAARRLRPGACGGPARRRAAARCPALVAQRRTGADPIGEQPAARRAPAAPGLAATHWS
jgi:hypothetical protein